MNINNKKFASKLIISIHYVSSSLYFCVSETIFNNKTYNSFELTLLPTYEAKDLNQKKNLVDESTAYRKSGMQNEFTFT